MDRALEVDLVLDEIFSNCDFNKLKELRLVNKKWNEVINRQLRKRCTKITLIATCKNAKFRQYEELDSCLLNHEISARIPLEIEVHESVYWKENSWWIEPYFWTCERLLNANWRNNIVKVIDSDIGDQVGNLASFLLQLLPSLKELELGFRKRWNSPEFNGPCVPPAPPEVKFEKLESLIVMFFGNTSGRRIETIDLRFLSQCPSLKTISIVCYNWPEMLLEFFQRWEEIYWDNPTMQRYHHVSLAIRIAKAFAEYEYTLNAIITQFINANEPASLTLEGNFFCNIPSFFCNLKSWAWGIRSLTTSFSIDDGRGLDWMLQLLKRFQVFANLTELCLQKGKEDTELNEYDVGRGPWKHDLSKVVSLELCCDENAWQSDGLVWLLQASAQLHNVTRLHLRGMVFFDATRCTSREKVSEFFNACKQFPVLRHLEMDLTSCRFGWQRLPANRSEDIPVGYLKDLAVLDGLKTFRVVTRIERFLSPASIENMLVALFHGYEPHVSLRLDVEVSLDWYMDTQQQVNYKLQLTVEDFYQDLLEAEAEVAYQKRE